MTTNPDGKMLYAVYWKGRSVLKVGRAAHMARIHRFNSTGAETILLVGRATLEQEKAAHAALGKRYKRAFADSRSSEELLAAGRGFTECFTVPWAALPLAIRVVVDAVASKEKAA